MLKFIKEYKDSFEKRTVINSKVTAIINFLWSVVKFILGICLKSYFLCMIAIFTFIVGMMKSFALRGIKNNVSGKKMLKEYIFGGILMMIAGVLYSLYMSRLIFYKIDIHYNIIPAITISAFSFIQRLSLAAYIIVVLYFFARLAKIVLLGTIQYLKWLFLQKIAKQRLTRIAYAVRVTAKSLTLSIIGIVKIKGKNLMFKGIKLLSFSTALTDIALTQIAILSFTTTFDLSIYNGWFGIFVGVIIVGVGLYIVINGKKLYKSFC